MTEVQKQKNGPFAIFPRDCGGAGSSFERHQSVLCESMSTAAHGSSSELRSLIMAISSSTVARGVPQGIWKPRIG
jgi:hypothetical protein